MNDSAAQLAALVLGSAAGGGFPQWNCACRLCSLVRAGDKRLKPRTQASVAFSADDRHWIVIGASPDMRQQVLSLPALHPNANPRGSPVAGVVLVSADIDGIAGLLTLRERHAFRIYAPAPIMRVLRANSVFGVLDTALVEQVEILPSQKIDCGHGLSLTLLPMPGKVPLYMESQGATEAEPGPAFAAMVQAHGRTAIVAPACAQITEAVREQLRAADLLFFDGTVFTDDEMIRAGVGGKTGQRMGHVPMAGPDGSMARLADLPGRRIYLHINNTNPVLLEDSPERLQAETAGFEIAHDGMEVRL
jgi:pyrroloquinoline quinone biosynthesis protein B